MIQRYVILAALLGLISLVSCHMREARARPCDSWLGYSDDDWRGRWPIDSHQCRCTTGRNRQNVCSSRTGVTKLGCPVSNRYVQCTDATCSVETCPAQQVWNFTINACAQCAPGMHVDTMYKQRCVCDRGTRSNRTTRQCVSCPTGAVVEEDRCYCPPTLTFNLKANNCSTCPAGSSFPQLFGECLCLDSKMFWNADEWQCQPCPGTWTSAPRRGILGRIFGWNQQTCTCTGTNQVFDRKSVSCFTCPSTTIVMDAMCKCKIGGEVFDSVTKTCICERGRIRGANGACVLNESEAAPTGPINP